MSIPSGIEPAEDAKQAITRAALMDGSFMAMVRAIAGITAQTDNELAVSLSAILAARRPPADTWIFGYGSLIWNPAFRFVERRNATLHGWHRRFSLWAPFGRGSPAHPGLMLALDRGGRAEGVAFRLAITDERDELMLVWRREMFSGAYQARWVTLETAQGDIQAITFVANPLTNFYAPVMGDEEAAAYIATARGSLGTCAEYLLGTVAPLAELGLKDEALDVLKTLVVQRLQEELP